MVKSEDVSASENNSSLFEEVAAKDRKNAPVDLNGPVVYSNLGEPS